MRKHHVYMMTSAERVALRVVVARIDDWVRGQGQSPPSDESNERAWYRAHDAAARVFAECQCSKEDMEAAYQAAEHLGEERTPSPYGECSICWPVAVDAAEKVNG